MSKNETDVDRKVRTERQNPRRVQREQAEAQRQAKILEFRHRHGLIPADRSGRPIGERPPMPRGNFNVPPIERPAAPLPPDPNRPRPGPFSEALGPAPTAPLAPTPDMLPMRRASTPRPGRFTSAFGGQQPTPTPPAARSELAEQVRAYNQRAFPELREQLPGPRVSGTTVREDGSTVPIEDTAPGYADPTERVSLGARFESAANRFARTAVADLPAGFLEGVAVLAKQLDPFGEYEDREAQELATYQAAQKIRAFAEEAFPTNRALQEQFVADVLPQAFGSAVGFLAGGAATRLLRGSSAVFAGGAGGLMQAGSAYTEAKQHGASEEDALLVGTLATALGATEAAPIERMLNRFAPGVNRTWKQILRDALISGGEEGLQEAIQQIGSNILAQAYYDAERETLEGVGTGVAAGLITGGVLGGGTSAAGQLARRSRERRRSVDQTDAEAAAEESPAEALERRAEERAAAADTAPAIPEPPLPVGAAPPPQQPHPAPQPIVSPEGRLAQLPEELPELEEEADEPTSVPSVPAVGVDEEPRRRPQKADEPTSDDATPSEEDGEQAVTPPAGWRTSLPKMQQYARQLGVEYEGLKRNELREKIDEHLRANRAETGGAAAEQIRSAEETGGAAADAEAPAAPEREPWEMSLDVFQATRANSSSGVPVLNARDREVHRNSVQLAIQQGKNVPPWVLKDYPDLMADAGPEAEVQAAFDEASRRVERGPAHYDFRVGAGYARAGLPLPSGATERTKQGYEWQQARQRKAADPREPEPEAPRAEPTSVPSGTSEEEAASLSPGPRAEPASAPAPRPSAPQARTPEEEAAAAATAAAEEARAESERRWPDDAAKRNQFVMGAAAARIGTKGLRDAPAAYTEGYEWQQSQSAPAAEPAPAPRAERPSAPQAEEPAPPFRFRLEYTSVIPWHKPKGSYAVYSSDLGANLADGFATREEAQQWQREYLDAQRRRFQGGAASAPAAEPAPAPAPAPAAEPAPAPAPAPKKPAYGESNTVVTKDAYLAARDRLRKKLNDARSGIDPETLNDAIIVAGYHLEAGVREFGAWSRTMLEDIGEGIRPYLKAVYNAARDWPGYTFGADMTPHADMDAALASIDERTAADTSSTQVAPSQEIDDERDRPRVGGEDRGGLSGVPGGRRGAEPGPESSDTRDVAPGQPEVLQPPTEGGAGEEGGVRGAGEDVAGGEEVPGVRNARSGRSGTGRTGSSNARSGRSGTESTGASGAVAKDPSNVSPANPGPGNFHLDNPLEVVGGGQVARFDKNRAAIEKFNELVAEGRQPTREEQQILAAYTGWGSFGQELFQGSWEYPRPKSGWEKRDQWLRDHLGKEAWESAQRSIINAHYTDPPTVLAMWDMVRRMGFQGGRVLEPGMGVGNFFAMMPLQLKNRSRLSGIELDETTGGIAKMLYPDADIRIMGYQQSKTPDDFFDLVIGNWPFDETPVADRKYLRLNAPLHDFYFLKALDQVRPGGIVIGITSAGTMDKRTPTIRRELAKKAELVSAFRLPSGAFEQYAGTKVVTDIIILRKREQPVPSPDDANWIETTEIDTPSGHKVRVNQYFADHPDHVVGTINYGHGTTTYRPGMIVDRPSDMEAELQRIINLVPEAAFLPRRKAETIRYVTNHTDDREGSLTQTPDGFFIVRGEQLAAANDVRKYKLKDGKKTAEREAQFRALIEMRRRYARLIEAEQGVSGEDPEVARKALRQSYEAFVRDHGPLSESYGLDYLEKIEDPFHASLAALEVDGKPATILRESTMRRRQRVENPTIQDAYVLARAESINPTIERIAELAGKPVDEVRRALVEDGAMFETPGGDVEPADIYLAGNVREKLRQAEAGLADGNEAMRRNVEALKKVIPPDIPYFNIEVQFGASWIPTRVYEEFVAHMLNRPNTDGITVTYTAGYWRVVLQDGFNFLTEANTGFGTTHYPFSRLVNAAISNQTVTIKRRDRDGRTYIDHDATTEANAKIAEIREKFGEWLWSDAERRVAMEQEYNEVRNAFATPSYDGRFLTFEGMALQRGNDPFNLREHQINAIWRGLVTRRSLAAHEVGTGKTYTIAGIAVESRRYGLAQKPLVLAHNANSKAVALGIQQMYPGAKVLYIDNLSPKNIDVKLRQIANDDWDAVVLPHSLIDRLSFTEETLMEMAREELDLLEAEARAAAAEDGVGFDDAMLEDPEALKRLRSPTAKELVKARKRILEQIQKQAIRSTRENAMPFEELGIDMVLVDEVHVFKKPPFSTRMRMKGLQTQSSDRSISLSFITRYIRTRNNGNVHLFTGTPITNTLTEIFHLQRYLMKEEMETYGVDQWDGWFGSYAGGTTDVELTAAGDYEPVTRLRAFVNVPELRQAIGQYMDVVFADTMPEMRPRRTASGKTLDDPTLTEAERAELLNGRTEAALDRPYKKIIVDTADLTPEQDQIFRRVQQLAQKFRDMSPRERREAQLNGMPEAPISYEQIAIRASLDARAANDEELAGMEGKVPDDPNSKISRAIRNIMEVYNSDERATQVVFTQLGLGTTAERAVRNADGSVMRDADNKTIRHRVKVFSPIRDMVERLVQQGFPREQIAIVDGSTSKEKRQEIADAMNEGKIRLVIGSTESLGVGVNMQKNLRAMHHLDAPWMPGDLEQRNGRGHRQGNQWNTVLEYRYVTDRLDGRRWQVLAIKQKFILAFLRGDNSTRVIEGDATADEESDILSTFAEAAGDPRVLILEKLRNKLKQLQNRERQHTQGIASAQRQARMERENRERLKRTIDEIEREGVEEAVAELVSENAGDGFSIEIDGRTYTKRTEAQEAIQRWVAKNLHTGSESTRAGSFGGHDLFIEWPRFASEPQLSISVKGHEIGTDRVLLQSLEMKLRGFGDRVDKMRKRYDDLGRTIERLEEVAKAPFARAAELDRTKKQLTDLEVDMARNPAAPPAWLRTGAPVDTDVMWNGVKFTVTGHRWTAENWYVVATREDGNEVAIPYNEAKDEQGMAIYDERDFTPPVIANQQEVPPGFEIVAPGRRPQRGRNERFPMADWAVVDAVTGAIITQAGTKDDVLREFRRSQGLPDPGTGGANLDASDAGGSLRIGPHDDTRTIRLKRRLLAQLRESRIQPDPIPGGDPKALSDIILDLSKSLNRRIQKGKRPKGVLGTYFTGSARLTIRYAGDLDTTAHEIGHALDDAFNLVGDYAADHKRSPFDEELIPNFSQHGSVTTSGPKSKLWYQRAEGVAEWIRAWIVNPAAAEAAAPQFAAHVKATLPEDVQAKIKAFSDDVRRFAGLSAHDRAKANIESKPRSRHKETTRELKAKLRGEGFEFTGTTWIDRLDAKLRDALAPVMRGIEAAQRIGEREELDPEEDPKLLMRLFGGVNDKIQDILENGMVDSRNNRVTAGGLDWLLGWADTSTVDSIHQDMRDVSAFMVNQRIVERAKQIDAKIQRELEVLHDRFRLGILKKQLEADPENEELRRRVDRLIARTGGRSPITRAMFSRRATGLRERAEKQKARIGGIGAGVFADDKQAAEALAQIERDPERRVRIEEGARRYREWADATLRYMVEKGRLSQKAYDKIVEANEFYVAMHRVTNEIDPEAFPAHGISGSGKRLGSAARLIQRFRGSTREIGNPFINLLAQTNAIVREADRNEAVRAFTDLLRSDRGMYEGEDVTNFGVIGSKAQQGDTNAISVWVDGEEEKWQFEEGIHQALKNWNEIDNPGAIAMLLRIPGAVMRYFVTHSPDFLVRNVIRDATHRSIVSRTGSKPWDILHLISGEEQSALRIAGGGQAGWYRRERMAYYDELTRQMKLLANDKGTILVRASAIPRAWEKLSQGSEMIGRLAEFRRALEYAKNELGYDDYNAQLYAAFQARDLIDYAVAGTLVRQLNRYVPFVNPGVQALSRMIRGAKEDPKRLATLWSIFALAPTLATYAWAAAGGEDDEEEYRQLPSYQRDFFFNFKVGPDLWLRIPKSFEAGVLASGVERMIDAVNGADEPFEGYFGSLVRSFSPVDENVVLGPFRLAYEMRANYDFFRERHIIPPYEASLELRRREGAQRASNLGKALSALLPGEQDPRMMDYLVQSEFGGIGRTAIRASDLGRRDRSKRTGGALIDTGLFVNSPVSSARDVEFVLSEATRKGEQNTARIRALRKQIDRYYNAKTPEAKDKAARAVRTRARSLRRRYESRGSVASVE